LEGTDFEPFDDRQYDSLASLTAALKNAYPLKNVTGHEYIAPGRKTDPGPFFDWSRYTKLYHQTAEKSAKTDVQQADLLIFSR
jgi:AmpD protein